MFRVVEAVTALDPDAVALEIAPIATPLFRSYARRGDADPDTVSASSPSGGEMSAAIGAAGDARTIGIDLPNAAAIGPVSGTLRAESLSARDALRVGRAFGTQTLHAVRCRLSHAASRVGVDIDPDLDRGRAPDARAGSPVEQAAEEDAAVSAGKTLLRALSRPPATAAFDRAREAAMTEELRALRRDGSDVVAVLGHAHLDPIAERLEGE